MVKIAGKSSGLFCPGVVAIAAADAKYAIKQARRLTSRTANPINPKSFRRLFEEIKIFRLWMRTLSVPLVIFKEYSTKVKIWTTYWKQAIDQIPWSNQITPTSTDNPALSAQAI